MSTSEVDATFPALPYSIRKRIDSAFDDALGSKSQTDYPRKRRKVSNAGGFVTPEVPSAGGFIVDEPAPGGFIIDDPAPGGFIPEESTSGGGFIIDEDDANLETTQEGPSQIPLSLIPTALQLLDLPPDDEDVLSVFRNAASGWSDSSRGSRPREDGDDQFVSRKDWRAVCAALLDTGDASNDADDADEDGGDVEMQDQVEEEDDVPSGEEYDPSDSSPSSAEADDDDGEYNEGGGGFVPSKKSKGKQPARGTRSRKKTMTDEDFEDDDVLNAPKRITPRQKAECRRTFALFFPDVGDEELDKKRIMIRDVSRVATLLKEKLTAENVCAYFRPVYIS